MKPHDQLSKRAAWRIKGNMQDQNIEVEIVSPISIKYIYEQL